MEATKKQLIQFFTEKFEDPEGKHPTVSEIDSFKKGELVDYITEHHLEEELELFVSEQN